MIRVLLLADTHLGFDLPFRPRVERRRRGHDFFSNFETALKPALNGEVDLVVHGGDLFYRSRIPEVLVEMAMNPLIAVADAGTDVYIVPGNHERSTIPLHLWTIHPKIHIFERPQTFVWTGAGGSIALSGFPFTRKIQHQFANLVTQTEYDEAFTIPHLLCMHQAVEGAQVGAHNYTFRNGADVVRGKDIPQGFQAVLSGHIHRVQTLTHDLREMPLAAPVIYPGSVERTSFAERTEEKGYVIVSIDAAAPTRAASMEILFVPLPARPMVMLSVEPRKAELSELSDILKTKLDVLDPDSVVRVDFQGPNAEKARQILSAAYLRRLAPKTMNISMAQERQSREVSKMAE